MRKKMRVTWVPLALALLAGQSWCSASFAQSALDPKLTGDWIKVNTGDQIRIRNSGEAELFLSGEASMFNGNGGVEKCNEGGANLCIKLQRVNCAFRYSFVQNALNLQFRTGSPDIACKALSGDFQKRQD